MQHVKSRSGRMFCALLIVAALASAAHAQRDSDRYTGGWYQPYDRYRGTETPLPPPPRRSLEPVWTPPPRPVERPRPVWRPRWEDHNDVRREPGYAGIWR